MSIYSVTVKTQISQIYDDIIANTQEEAEQKARDMFDDEFSLDTDLEIEDVDCQEEELECVNCGISWPVSELDENEICPDCREDE